MKKSVVCKSAINKLPTAKTQTTSELSKNLQTVCNLRTEPFNTEELAKNQSSNLDHCRSDYDKYYSDSVDTMLRNGDDIPATTLIIQDPSGNNALRRYVDTFGVEHLNNEQIFVNFNQKTDNPDHCVYFALKDMGINKIPVYADSQTLEAGHILGLF